MSSERKIFLIEKRSFTLIELLVVIAIITILAAILAPVLARSRAIARTTLCINNIKQLSTVMRFYAEEFQTVPPTYPGCCWGSTPYGWPEPQWTFTFRTYAESNGARMRPYFWEPGGWREGDLYCPSGFEYKDNNGFNRMDYNINFFITVGKYGPFSDWPNFGRHYTSLLDNQRNPERLVLFLDGCDAWNKLATPFGDLWGNVFYDGVSIMWRMLGLVHHTALKGTVFSFWDGHVVLVPNLGSLESYYDENSDILQWRVY